ncbi:MAG: S1C family serine protease [Phycisphaerae bacterium]|nr:S1C family serine protease [Phycisphaerae bacterium]MDW8261283.1 S1C family serine protease [Phycisphaerales bacterium]
MILRGLLALCLALGLTTPTWADPVLTALARLSQETQSLYEKCRGQLVRAYLPTPNWALNLMEQDFTIKRWDLSLPPEAARRLREELARSPSQKYTEGSMGPSTHPTDADADDAYTLVPRGDGSFELVGGRGEDKAVLSIGARSIGVVVDAQGHVLLPYYIEADLIRDHPLTVRSGDGAVATARFVGADRQTFLTVLKLDQPPAQYAGLSGRQPAEGALAMFLNMTGEYGRLTVWTGTLQDSGLVISVDGQVCGFLRQGQFLETARCKPVVEQIVARGKVSRPSLGVYVREVLPADFLRRENRLLGSRPAVVVLDVKSNSAAERAGIRRNDLILAIGGETVGDPPNFAAVMTSLAGRVPLTILRGQEQLELTVELPATR